jgi:hypothetical protein
LTPVLVGAATVSVITTEYPAEVTNVVVATDTVEVVSPSAVVDVTEVANIIVFVVIEIVV